jgi:hypothetical protein
MKLRILIILCLSLLPAPVSNAFELKGVPQELSTWQAAVARFDRFYFSDPAAIEKRRENFENQFKSDKISQWEFSEWAEAYATLYEVTGDIRYASALAEMIEIAFTYRDDKAGRVDGLTGENFPAWGLRDPYFNMRTVRLGTAALILSPAARLANIMKDKPELSALVGLEADDLREEILRSIRVFDPHLERLNGASRPARRYLIPQSTAAVACAEAGDEILEQWAVSAHEKCETQRNLAGTPEAYNIQLKMGLALIHLRKSMKAGEIDQRIAELANYFIETARLRKLSDGRSVAYDYAEGGRVEDVSHANLVAEFLVLAELEGPIDGERLVESETLVGLASAIVDYAAVLANDPTDGNRLKPVLTPYIDGSRAGNLDDPENAARLFGQRNSRIRRSCKQILLLALFDKRVGGLCGAIMAERGNASPLGIAYLAKTLKLLEQSSGSAP